MNDDFKMPEQNEPSNPNSVDEQTPPEQNDNVPPDGNIDMQPDQQPNTDAAANDRQDTVNGGQANEQTSDPGYTSYTEGWQRDTDAAPSQTPPVQNTAYYAQADGQNDDFSGAAHTENWQQSENPGWQTPPEQHAYQAQTNDPYAPVMAEQSVKPPRRKSKSSALIKALCVLLIAFLAFSAGVGAQYFWSIAGTNPNQDGTVANNPFAPRGTVEILTGQSPTESGDIQPDENGEYTPSQVAQLVSDSVVEILVYNDSNGQSTAATASGIVLDKTGYILSNDHIYADIPNAKFVVTLNSKNSYKAVYVAGDQRSDLCVLKLVDCDEELTPAVFDDSDNVKAGDQVIAIGSPCNLSGTVTSGIVSAPNRRLSLSSGTDGASSYSMKLIQTDTAINEGNSGGALVNLYGKVVGICVSKLVSSDSQYEGLCFAIPSNVAVKYATSLIENLRVVGRARLGITYTEVTSALSVVNELPSGLLIQEVSIDSDLQKEGIVKGDIITEVDGTTITSSDQALDIIDAKSAGDTIELKIYIAATGKSKTCTATLLEDTSVSSYQTVDESEQSTTFNPFNR